MIFDLYFWVQLAKTDLLILDDWGLEKMNLGQRNDLLEIMENRHGLKSTLVTSQLPLEQWHNAICDATSADAILDRLGDRIKPEAMIRMTRICTKHSKSINING